MLTTEQNEYLARTSRGTPMGDLMRRYWLPALIDWELPDPDCPPVEFKLLGETLVAFRDTSGRIGVVQNKCPHRRAGLFWGRNEENGLRCVYHGWKFDVSGACVDMPSEPPTSNYKDKVRIKAYKTAELGGVVWVYMGPPDKTPPLPKLDWTAVPANQRSVMKVVQECNWLQGLEGGIDTVHTGFLHRNLKGAGYSAMESARSVSYAVDVEVVPTNYGFTYAGIRRMAEGTDYIRAYHLIMPFHQYRPLLFNAESENRPRVNSHIWVPMDDETTMVWNLTWTYGSEPLSENEMAQKGSGNSFGEDVDPVTFRSHKNRENRWMIDREAQRTVNFTGIFGQNTQDRAIQETMGAICERNEEHLGTTDRAIIMARKLLMQAATTVEDGGDPVGLGEDVYRVRSYETVLPSAERWVDDLAPYLFELEYGGVPKDR